jgi:hypothetical protein
MIQLATDPTASRSSYRPTAGDDENKSDAFDTRRSRNGHAWPFLSRHADRPAHPNNQKPAANSSGS